jgi:hypothetical protein
LFAARRGGKASAFLGVQPGITLGVFGRSGIDFVAKLVKPRKAGMIRELILSVVSGVIVALILQMFGGRRRDTVPRRSVRNHDYAPPPRRRSLFGKMIRLVLAVAGGIAFAQVAAPFLFRRRFGDFGGFDRFDNLGGLSEHLPILVLTVIGTIVVWIFLSTVTRR